MDFQRYKNLLQETWESKDFFKGDKIIWIVLVWLTAISIVIVYSSTGALAYRRAGGDTSHYFLRQMEFQAFGYFIIIGMLIFVKVSKYNKLANLFFISSMALVCLGLIFGRGGEGTGRTLPLGFFNFQPAEFAKVALILWVARLLANTQKDPRLLRIAFFKIMTGVGAICLLVSLANFSSAVLLFLTAFFMMFIGRIQWKFLVSVGILGGALIVIIYFTAPYLSEKLSIGRFATIRSRLEMMIHPNKSSEKGLTQKEFAMIAIHRGGVLGVGAGKSEISNFMPAAFNDFIYSIIIEEYGLVGGIVVLLLYLTFLTRGGIIIRKSSRAFPMFVATGAVTLILLQAIINMIVSSGLFVTGQPLPWISWGGTSQLFTAFTFGLLLSVSSETEQELKKKAESEFNSECGPSDEEMVLTKF